MSATRERADRGECTLLERLRKHADNQTKLQEIGCEG